MSTKLCAARNARTFRSFSVPFSTNYQRCIKLSPTYYNSLSFTFLTSTSSEAYHWNLHWQSFLPLTDSLNESADHVTWLHVHVHAYADSWTGGVWGGDVGMHNMELGYGSWARKTLHLSVSLVRFERVLDGILCCFGLVVELQVAQLHVMGGLFVQSSRCSVAVVKSLHTGTCTCTTKLIHSSRASVSPVNTVKLWLYKFTCMW